VILTAPTTKLAMELTVKSQIAKAIAIADLDFVMLIMDNVYFAMIPLTCVQLVILAKLLLAMANVWKTSAQI
jgi:hypothetical protein